MHPGAHWKAFCLAWHRTKTIHSTSSVRLLELVEILLPQSTIIFLLIMSWTDKHKNNKQQEILVSDIQKHRPTIMPFSMKLFIIQVTFVSIHSFIRRQNNNKCIWHHFNLHFKTNNTLKLWTNHRHLARFSQSGFFFFETEFWKTNEKSVKISLKNSFENFATPLDLSLFSNFKMI